MKCAYLFSGQPIFYEDVLSYNSNYQITKDDRVCSHLWWDNEYFGKVYKMWFTDRYRQRDLDQKFIKQYGVTDSIIEKHKPFDLTFFNKFNFDVWKGETIEHYKVVTPIVLYSLLCQSYSNYQAFLQTQKYTDINIVVRSRPDIILLKPLKHILSQIQIQENTIYFQSSMNGGHLYAGEFPNRPCDWFFLGTPKSMEKYCRIWYESVQEEQENGIIHHYEYIHNICKKNDLNIGLVDFGAIIYKQATNWYEEYKIDSKFYVNNFDYEKSTPLEVDLWPYWVENINFQHFSNLK